MLICKVLLGLVLSIIPTPQDGQWKNATLESKIGDVRVTILDAKIDNVLLWNSITERSSESQDQHLLIRIELTNTSDTKKVNYKTFYGDDISFTEDYAILYDDFGNIYKRLYFGAGETIEGNIKGDSIYPGKSIRDTLAFEKPINKAETLLLALPGENCGCKGYFRISIPATSVSRKDQQKQELPPKDWDSISDQEIYKKAVEAYQISLSQSLDATILEYQALIKEKRGKLKEPVICPDGYSEAMKNRYRQDARKWKAALNTEIREHFKSIKKCKTLKERIAAEPIPPSVFDTQYRIGIFNGLKIIDIASPTAMKALESLELYDEGEPAWTTPFILEGITTGKYEIGQLITPKGLFRQKSDGIVRPASGINRLTENKGEGKSD